MEVIEMKAGDILDISKDVCCPVCGRPLDFAWESFHSENKVAGCCQKIYWISPSNFYRLNEIIDER
jgi:hypothetical protein